jgi:hypothetical protein
MPWFQDLTAECEGLLLRRDFMDAATPRRKGLARYFSSLFFIAKREAL